MPKTVHDLVIANEYEDGDGKPRQKYTNIGIAFENENTGYSLLIDPGIAVSGKVLMLPKGEKGDKTAD